jgi:hypothetical protein
MPASEHVRIVNLNSEFSNLIKRGNPQPVQAVIALKESGYVVCEPDKPSSAGVEVLFIARKV